MRRYQSLDHTADLQLRIFGQTVRELFQNAAYALMDTLTDVKKVRATRSRLLKLKGEGLDLLLIAFLKELLFLFDTKHFLTRRVVIKKLSDKILWGTLKGEKWGASGGRLTPLLLKREIKAVTYHRLKVCKVPVRERRIHSARAHPGGGRGGEVRAAAPRHRWTAEVIFDV